jgi:hypothetical protein
MRFTPFQTIAVFVLGLLLGYLLTRTTNQYDNFQDTKVTEEPICPECGEECPCKEHPGLKGKCPSCPPYPDMTKYVLKTSIPPCPSPPDMTNYMLKTECPPVPDMSKYVLKSSIPKQQPIIVDSSACKGGNCGTCPPCPRPRCPDLKCPAATVCPKPPPCPRPVCPPTDQVVKCRTEPAKETSMVRPFLAPISMNPFG